MCVCLDINLIQEHFYSPQVSMLVFLLFCFSDRRLLNQTGNHQTQQRLIVQGRHTDSAPSLTFEDTVFYCIYSFTVKTQGETAKKWASSVVSWKLNEVQQPAVKSSFSLMQESIAFCAYLQAVFYYTSYSDWRILGVGLSTRLCFFNRFCELL